MKRILTALVLIPPVVYLILAAPLAATTTVIALICLLCYHEYRGLAAGHGAGTAGPFGYAAGIVFLLAPGEYSAILLTVVAMLSLGLALRNSDMRQVLPQAAFVFLGVVYIFGPWRCAIALREMDPHLLFYAVVLNWVGDSAAYYGGRTFGKHRLAPVLSPKKTWEGTLCSVAASGIFGLLYLGRFVPEIPVWQVIALSVLANVSGQIGDLAESSVKRGAGVKDSGSLLPGHGGWLDRLDSTLFSLPVVYFWVTSPWLG